MMSPLRSGKQFELLLIVLGLIIGGITFMIVTSLKPAQPIVRLAEANGISQVFLGDKQITDSQKPHIHLSHQGDYAVWARESEYGWQVWQAKLMTGSQVELLRPGNNVNPKLYGQQVVWEGQVAGVWQIIWFDGVKMVQISKGELPKQNPRFDGNKIIYEELDAQAKVTLQEFTIPNVNTTNL